MSGERHSWLTACSIAWRNWGTRSGSNRRTPLRPERPGEIFKGASIP